MKPNNLSEITVTFDDPAYTIISYVFTTDVLQSFVVSANTSGLPLSKGVYIDGQLYTTIYQDA